MTSTQLTKGMSLLENLLFDFDNVPVKVAAFRKIPKIETSGLSLKGHEEKEEFTVNLWIASELVESGLASFVGEEIEVSELSKIHYSERMQPLDRLALLPERFYPRIYLSISEMRRGIRGDPARFDMFNRFTGMFRDILEGRIRKIVRLASLGAPTDQTKNLTPEEKILYGELSSIFYSWRTTMMNLVGE